MTSHSLNLALIIPRSSTCTRLFFSKHLMPSKVKDLFGQRPFPDCQDSLSAYRRLIFHHSIIVYYQLGPAFTLPRTFYQPSFIFFGRPDVSSLFNQIGYHLLPGSKTLCAESASFLSYLLVPCIDLLIDSKIF